jgi:hypothetical protein
MIARGFKPVGWVAGVAAAALSCYMLSLNVAAERAELAKVERQIIAAKQDIRTLQTELGTRGRLTQLEHWNAEVLALSAPASRQFLDSEFRLASFNQPQQTIDEQAAKVRMASADISAAPPVPRAAVVKAIEPSVLDARSMVRRASLVVEDKTPLAPPKPQVVRAAAFKMEPGKAAPAKSVVKKVEKKAPLIGTALLDEIGDAAAAEKEGPARR